MKNKTPKETIKEIYEDVSASISECLRGLNDTKRIENMLVFFKGYFDAKIEQIMRELDDVKQNVYVKEVESENINAIGFQTEVEFDDVDV